MQLLRFIEMLDFYRECVPKAAHSQLHLNKFLTTSKKKDKTPIKWDQVAKRAFEECKEKLGEVAFSAYPEENAPLRLVTDANDLAMGAALEIKTNSTWKQLAFFSKKFSDARTKYATHDR